MTIARQWGFRSSSLITAPKEFSEILKKTTTPNKQMSFTWRINSFHIFKPYENKHNATYPEVARIEWANAAHWSWIPMRNTMSTSYLHSHSQDSLELLCDFVCSNKGYPYNRDRSNTAWTLNTACVQHKPPARGIYCYELLHLQGLMRIYASCLQLAGSLTSTVCGTNSINRIIIRCRAVNITKTTKENMIVFLNTAGLAEHFCSNKGPGC